jgi:hypothetical protein
MSVSTQYLNWLAMIGRGSWTFRSSRAMAETPQWRIYERVAATFEAESVAIEATIFPNASLVGSMSGVKGQIDILVAVSTPK